MTPYDREILKYLRDGYILRELDSGYTLYHMDTAIKRVRSDTTTRLLGGGLIDYRDQPGIIDSTVHSILVYVGGIEPEKPTNKLMFRCTVCGKLTAGRFPTGPWAQGDGSARFPRKHKVAGKTCEGSYDFAEWVTVVYDEYGRAVDSVSHGT